MEKDIRISLAAARVNAGVNQREAAKKLGISKATLANYEAGKTIPDWDMAMKMEEVYQFPAANIIFARKYA